jgi:hypothetical protein
LATFHPTGKACFSCDDALSTTAALFISAIIAGWLKPLHSPGSWSPGYVGNRASVLRGAQQQKRCHLA